MISCKTWNFNTGSSITSTPQYYDKKLYCSTHNGELYSLNANSGKLLWKISLEEKNASTPLITEDNIYIVINDRDLLKLDRKTGIQKWIYRSPYNTKKIDFPWDFFHSTPYLWKDSIFYSDNIGNCYAIHKDTGELIWFYNPAEESINRRFLYVGNNSPIIYKDRLYYTSSEGLHSIDPLNGRELWRYSEKSIQISPRFYKNFVYIAGKSTEMTAIDIHSGEKLWSFDAGTSWITSTPIIDNNMIYFGSSDAKKLYVLDAVSGEMIFEQKTEDRIFSSPIVYGNYILFGDDSGSLNAFDPIMKKIAWTYLADGAIKTSITVNNQLIYFATDNGTIYAIKPPIN